MKNATLLMTTFIIPLLWREAGLRLQLQKLIMILLLTLPLRGLGGYAQSDSLLCRTWRIDFAQTYTLMSSAEKTAYDQLPEANRNRLRLSFERRRIRFSTGGNYRLTWQGSGGQAQRSGQWARLSHPQSLEIRWADGQVSQQTIIALDSQKLILEIDNNPSAAALFSKLYLIPSN
jgi:hypothetical protein